jgi:CBS domain-containing protein
VKSNFLAAARDGIRAQMNWFNDTHLPAKQLVLEHLLPLAREGLEESGIDRDDIDRYLGVLEDRVTHRRTGARWALESLELMSDRGTADQRQRCIVSSMVEQQASGRPISEWELASYCLEQDWRDSYRTVGQFMTQDLFTVRPDDIVDFAATIMDWRHVRHVPVEDAEGRLAGLVSHRNLLRLFAQGRVGENEKVTVGEIMDREPVVAHPDTPTVEAIRLMREKRLACLPVVRDDKLVGIVTEHDFIIIASRLLEEQLSPAE